MRSFGQLHNQYEDYQEYMSANGGTTNFTFGEWINHFLSVNELSQEEHRKCYTADGYLIKPKMRMEYD